MRKMLDRVNKETREVEDAVAGLKDAQEALDKDTVGQLSTLKSGGLVKQATLVGAALFSFRSVAEGIAFFAGDSSHLVPAAVQAGIAVVCLIAFVVL